MKKKCFFLSNPNCDLYKKLQTIDFGRTVFTGNVTIFHVYFLPRVLHRQQLMHKTTAQTVGIKTTEKNDASETENREEGTFSHDSQLQSRPKGSVWTPLPLDQFRAKRSGPGSRGSQQRATI